jgi:hypothetical protein
MYKDVAKDIDKFTIKIPKTIVPIPSASDYENGFIERYFLRVSFDSNGFVYEVNEKIFDEYSENAFWVGERLFWRIAGPMDVIYDDNGGVKDKGVINSNKASISIASLKIKNISLYLPNLKQFHK